MGKKREVSAAEQRDRALAAVREALGVLAAAVTMRYGEPATTAATAARDAQALADLAAQLAALAAGPGLTDGR